MIMPSTKGQTYTKWALLLATIQSTLTSVSSAAASEWAGVFAVDGTDHTWSMQAKDDGTYPDQTMRLVLIPTSAPTEATMHSSEAAGEALIADDDACVVVEDGETMTPAAPGSCFELHVGTGTDSTFTIVTTGITGLVMIAQHVPIEFERDRHYFYNAAGTDIEPIAQEGAAHDHGHGDEHKETCGCAAKEAGWEIDCVDVSIVTGALANLEDDGCATTCGGDCLANYLILQAHHDHCPHGTLDVHVSNTLFHSYEGSCGDGCAVERQFDADAASCPVVDCTSTVNQQAVVDKLKDVTTYNCMNSCTADCAAAFTEIVAFHDTCTHEQVLPALETALHDYEDACEDVVCNTHDAAFDANVCEKAHGAFEWAGVFAVDGTDHTWSMQAKDDGTYPDQTMRLVLIPTSTPTEATMHSSEAAGKDLIVDDDACVVVEDGGSMTPAAPGSCFELHVGTGTDSTFTIVTTGITGLVMIAQHVPIEFERDRHYFYNAAGTDIEPIAQEGAAHDHGHGDEHKETCGCAAKEAGWEIDCVDVSAVTGALAHLADDDCATTCGGDCLAHYLILQAHHDHCPHGTLDVHVSNTLFHSYEGSCGDGCAVERQFDADAASCPVVDCTSTVNQQAVVDKLKDVTTYNCMNSCTADCAAAFTEIVAFHDTCTHEQVLPALEIALHDYEEVCEDVVCNTHDAAFDANVCDARIKQVVITVSVPIDVDLATLDAKDTEALKNGVVKAAASTGAFALEDVAEVKLTQDTIRRARRADNAPIKAEIIFKPDSVDPAAARAAMTAAINSGGFTVSAEINGETFTVTITEPPLVESKSNVFEPEKDDAAALIAYTTELVRLATDPAGLRAFVKAEAAKCVCDDFVGDMTSLCGQACATHAGLENAASSSTFASSAAAVVIAGLAAALY